MELFLLSSSNEILKTLQSHSLKFILSNLAAKLADFLISQARSSNH